MRTHSLKTLPPYWERVQTGEKTFEIRKNDRDFQVGDILELEYYDPNKQIVVGYNFNCPPIIAAVVKYVFCGGQYGLETGYCIMSIEIIK